MDYIFLNVCVGIALVLVAVAIVFCAVALILKVFPAFEKAYFLYAKVKRNLKGD